MEYKNGFGYPEKGAIISIISMIKSSLCYNIIRIAYNNNYQNNAIDNILGDYWLGLDSLYNLMNQNNEENKDVSYGLDIDLWTTTGEHLVARY